MAKPSVIRAPEPLPTVEELTVVAFGVVYIPETKQFIPTRFGLRNNEVTSEAQCGPAGPYRALAYQYAANALQQMYMTLQLKEVREKS